MFIAAVLAGALTFSALPGAIPDTEDTWIGTWRPEKVTVQPSKHVVPDLTPNELNQMWSNSPKTNPSIAEKTGKADKIGGKWGKGAGVAVAGLSSFSFGYDVGTGIARTFGLPTTGSLSCDLTQALFNSGVGCGPAPVPDYIPNTDISEFYIPPGWGARPGFNFGKYEGAKSHSAGNAWVDLVETSPTQWDMTELIEVVCSSPGSTTVWLNLTVFYYNGTQQKQYSGGGGLLPCVGPRSRIIQANGMELARVDFFFRQTGLPDWNFSYFGVTNPDRPEDLSPTPQRSWQITGMCMDGNPFNVGSAWFEETSPEWEPLPAIPCDPSAVTISQLIDGYGEQVMATWNIPPEVEQWRNDNPDGSKELDLLRIGGITEPISCFSATELCSPEWFLEMDKNTKYQCQYGGQPVALSECNVYRPTFNPQRVIQGQRYSDPDGKLPDPLPNNAPEPKTEAQECFPSGWGLFNPAEWVLKPIKCAFVPRESVLTGQITAVRVALANSPIGGLWSLVQPPVVPSGQSCGVIADVTVPNFGRVKIDSCDWVAWAPTVRNFLHWIILAFGLYGIMFWILRKVTKNAVSEVEK